MKKKFLTLVERDSAAELAAYFAALPKGKPLDTHEEKVLLEYYPSTGIETYINRFKFSEEAEKIFVEKATGKHRRSYINFYGLYPSTQKFILDKGLTDVAFDFIRMRRFADVTYLLEKGKPEVIRTYVMNNALDNDEQVLMLLHHDNTSLFKAYVDQGHFISEDIFKTVIEEKNRPAFNALMFYIHRRFKKKARTMTLKQMIEKQVADVMMPEDLQLLVLDSDDRMFIEQMLCTTVLSPAAQKTMFDRNYDAEWFKLHVEHFYGVAGYRFEPELEERLFKLLSSKSLDECLAKFRARDEVSFVRLGSSEAVKKFIKTNFPSDDAQVALLSRGNADLAKVLISRYSPEHGMCWQAEVKLVEIYSPEVIKEYISFHSMCGEGLAKLGVKSPETLAFYYTKHAY